MRKMQASTLADLIVMGNRLGLSGTNVKKPNPSNEV
jgi:hypothetical protein